MDGDTESGILRTLEDIAKRCSRKFWRFTPSKIKRDDTIVTICQRGIKHFFANLYAFVTVHRDDETYFNLVFFSGIMRGLAHPTHHFPMVAVNDVRECLRRKTHFKIAH